MRAPSQSLSRAEWRAAVRQALHAVPRERFVRPEDQGYAHLDCALPIGFGQTISQPSLVARMTELLDLRPGAKVLEIGTGSGYQTAILAALPEVDVYSVEIIPALAAAAAERLRSLGLTQPHLRLGDGYDGWPEHAPYDGIIVTAAPETVPPPLLDQLADDGRLVIPVGPNRERQWLRRVVRHGAAYHADDVLAVAFVPLTRQAAPSP